MGGSWGAERLGQMREVSHSGEECQMQGEDEREG